jgi:hypothetical protein
METSHADAVGSFIPEIEFDQHSLLVPDDPSIVTRFNGDHLRRPEFADAAVGELHVNLSMSEESNMGMHAEIGFDVRLHIPGPAEADGIHHAFHPAIAYGDDVHNHPANFAAVGIFHRSEQILRHGHTNDLLCSAEAYRASARQ